MVNKMYPNEFVIHRENKKYINDYKAACWVVLGGFCAMGA